MEKQVFQDLLEIQSLNTNIYNHEDKIDEHQKRCTFIREQKEDKLDHLGSLKAELQDRQNLLATKERELHETETQLGRTREHISLANCEKQVTALEHELATLEPKASELESEILSLMEACEKLESRINETQEFLSGIDSTISEIDLEVNQDIEVEKKEINNYSQRITSLLGELPKEIQDAYKILSGNIRLYLVPSNKVLMSFFLNHSSLLV